MDMKDQIHGYLHYGDLHQFKMFKQRMPRSNNQTGIEECIIIVKQ